MVSSKLIKYYEVDEVSVEGRYVQDIFIQWNGVKKPNWSKMLSIGLEYIEKTWSPKDKLIIRKEESAWCYMVSCQEWTSALPRVKYD